MIKQGLIFNIDIMPDYLFYAKIVMASYRQGGNIKDVQFAFGNHLFCVYQFGSAGCVVGFCLADDVP